LRGVADAFVALSFDLWWEGDAELVGVSAVDDELVVFDPAVDRPAADAEPFGDLLDGQLVVS
jgi:hypothetical protein